MRCPSLAVGGTTRRLACLRTDGPREDGRSYFVMLQYGNAFFSSARPSPPRRVRGPGRAARVNFARFQFGKANTTRVPPRGRPLLPPPAAMTTYCRPLTM